MRRLRRLLGSRMLLFLLMFLTEIGVIMVGVYLVSRWIVPIYIALYLLESIVIIYIINSGGPPTYQINWLLIATFFPLVTGVLYLLFGSRRVAPKFRREHLMNLKKFKPLLEGGTTVLDKVSRADDSAYKQIKYISDYSFFPAYENNRVTYFSSGEEMYESIIAQLEKAEKSIYIEMFIMQEGKVLNTIVDILRRKVEQGVDVRVIYDDMGCSMYLPRKYYKKLQSYGIKCEVFNPLRPILMITMNNRDHRKLVIIDGKVAFTGGINFSDEYINEVELYGHWKDAGIMIEGTAVSNMTIMFLQFWNSEADYNLSAPDVDFDENMKEKGVILPFSDSPTDSEDISKCAHLNMIWESQKNVYIMTPYLVIDNELLVALKQAAKNGVDVRIIVPHIPDKWYVLETTRSFYKELISSGVRIYEYTPGFIHSKVMMSDDSLAIVGTINMDNRSYYLDFECGVFMYGTDAIRDIRKDFTETFAQCQEIDMADCLKVPFIKRAVRAVLKVFSPLM